MFAHIQDDWMIRFLKLPPEVDMDAGKYDYGWIRVELIELVGEGDEREAIFFDIPMQLASFVADLIKKVASENFDTLRDMIAYQTLKNKGNSKGGDHEVA